MNERYFYLIRVNGELTNMFYSPKYKLEKITIASNDFVSDIEAFGEISKLLNDPVIEDNYEIKFNFNKKYFPNKEQSPKKIENMFDVWQEYSLDEVINTIAYITITKQKLELELEEVKNDDEEDILSPLPIHNGIEIKLYVISRKENLIELLQPKDALVH